MRRRCRMSHQALGISQIVGNVDEAQRIEKTEAGLFVAGHIKADEAAALSHLLTRELVLRVARQAGVEHARDLWMALQITGDRLSGPALAIDPQVEGFEALEQQPGVERAQRRSGVPVKGTEVVLDEFLRCQDRAPKAAPLAIDVLGR